jgi:DNA-binding MarR family transcriptional regulator
VTQQSLCALTSKDKPSITRLIDKLEKQGLVERIADVSDRRINLIHLTRKGAQMEAKATEIVQQIAERTLMDITEEELMMSRVVLKKIMANLE